MNIRFPMAFLIQLFMIGTTFLSLGAVYIDGSTQGGTIGQGEHLDAIMTNIEARLPSTGGPVSGEIVMKAPLQLYEQGTNSAPSGGKSSEPILFRSFQAGEGGINYSQIKAYYGYAPWWCGNIVGHYFAFGNTNSLQSPDGMIAAKSFHSLNGGVFFV